MDDAQWNCAHFVSDGIHIEHEARTALLRYAPAGQAQPWEAAVLRRQHRVPRRVGSAEVRAFRLPPRLAVVQFSRKCRRGAQTTRTSALPLQCKVVISCLFDKLFGMSEGRVLKGSDPSTGFGRVRPWRGPGFG